MSSESSDQNGDSDARNSGESGSRIKPHLADTTAVIVQTAQLLGLAGVVVVATVLYAKRRPLW